MFFPVHLNFLSGIVGLAKIILHTELCVYM